MNLRTCSLNNPGDDTADSEIIEEQISAIFFPLSNFEKETKQKKKPGLDRRKVKLFFSPTLDTLQLTETNQLVT